MMYNNKPMKQEGLKKISEDTSKDEEDEERNSLDQNVLNGKKQEGNPDSNERRKSFRTIYQAQKSEEEDSAYDSKNLDEI